MAGRLSRLFRALGDFAAARILGALEQKRRPAARQSKSRPGRSNKPPGGEAKQRRHISVPLIVGDPQREPASSLRFVLPFGYRLVREQGPDATGPTWQPAGPMNGGREFYFTPETARVLFHRTRRFVLRGLDTDICRFRVPRRSGSGCYQVEVAAPELTLFEYRDPGLHQQAPEDLLALGFLQLDLFFPHSEAAPDLDEFLELAEIFRHVLEPFTGHAHDGEEGGHRRGLATVLGDLPLRFWRSDGEAPRRAKDLVPRTGPVAEAAALGRETTKDLYFDRWATLLQQPLEVAPGEMLRLFPADWTGDAHAWPRQPLREGGTGWVVYGDHRAFVWSSAIMAGGLKGLKEALHAPEQEPWQLGHWVKLVNADPPGTAPEEISKFEADWAQERTYQRWLHEGSAYGFSYHSGAMLAAPATAPALWRHFRENYFDQTLLFFYLRVTCFRFSLRLTEISAGARREQEATDEWPEGYRQSFRQLRRDFAIFTNLYRFPLLSNQQQGLELYELARKHLDVDSLFHEVEREIQSTHDFFQMDVAHELNHDILVLTVFGTFGLLASIVVGFFGMNFFVPGTASGLTATKEWLYLLSSVALAALVFAWLNIRYGLLRRLRRSRALKNNRTTRG